MAHLVRKVAEEASLVAAGEVETVAVVEAAEDSPMVVVEVAATTVAATTGNPRIFRFFPQEGPVVNQIKPPGHFFQLFSR
jgi:hypothetical protein